MPYLMMIDTEFAVCRVVQHDNYFLRTIRGISGEAISLIGATDILDLKDACHDSMCLLLGTQGF